MLLNFPSHGGGSLRREANVLSVKVGMLKSDCKFTDFISNYQIFGTAICHVFSLFCILRLFVSSYSDTLYETISMNIGSHKTQKTFMETSYYFSDEIANKIDSMLYCNYQNNCNTEVYTKMSINCGVVADYNESLIVTYFCSLLVGLSGIVISIRLPISGLRYRCLKFLTSLYPQ